MCSFHVAFHLYSKSTPTLNFAIEITMAMDALMNVPYFQDSSHVIIYPLHLSLSSTEQTSIFQQPPSGKRKVVLSTNIAETSKNS